MNNDQITPSDNNGPIIEPNNQPQPAGFGLGGNPAGQTSPPSDNSSAQVPPVDIPEPQPIGQNSPSLDTSPGSNTDLEELRKEALTKLSPLVSKLDQAPEEKFHTLMMVIQSSDNQSLIKTAYEAANQIEDETKKAEALLSIVNEINYFTKKDQDTTSS